MSKVWNIWRQIKVSVNTKTLGMRSYCSLDALLIIQVLLEDYLSDLSHEIFWIEAINMKLSKLNIFKRLKKNSPEKERVIRELQCFEAKSEEKLEKQAVEIKEILARKDQEIELKEMELKMIALQMEIQAIKLELNQQKEDQQNDEATKMRTPLLEPAKDRLTTATLVQHMLAVRVKDKKAAKAVSVLMRNFYA